MSPLAFWRDVLKGRRGARVMLAAWAALIVAASFAAALSGLT